MHEDERYLIQRAQRGDAEAHATLYDRHYDAVYRFCYYRLSDPDLAQDITGEVFARMAEKLDTFRMRGRPLLAWLYTIARNLVTDAHRRNGKATFVPLSEASSIAADGEANPARSVERRLEAECLGLAMRHLTEEQRQVIVLSLNFAPYESNREQSRQALAGRSASGGNMRCQSAPPRWCAPCS